MKVNYDKAIQVNNELKVNVDDQQVDMKYLKEKYDTDDEDKVQKTTVAKTPMKKSKSVCVTCYQTFAMTNCLKILIQKGHTKLCEIVFEKCS